MEISNGFVCAMGIGVVFVGLICIVILCSIMSFFCKDRKQPQPAAAPAPAAPAQPAPIANKQELIAGICAVIAEELGTEVKNIRVLSFKKIV